MTEASNYDRLICGRCFVEHTDITLPRTCACGHLMQAENVTIRRVPADEILTWRVLYLENDDIT